MLYNNESYQCINNTNTSSFAFRNTTTYPKNIKNITIDFSKEEEVGEEIEIKSNVSNTNCNSEALTMREILIILGFSIVILIIITYNIVQFFELKKEDCCCYKKQITQNNNEMERKLVHSFLFSNRLKYKDANHENCTVEIHKL